MAQAPRLHDPGAFSGKNRAPGVSPWHHQSVPFPPLKSALHALALYVAAGIAAFGWACCALVGWDARPWMPLWFAGALLIYNIDRLRPDPADRINLPARTATVESLRPVAATLAALAAAVLLALPLVRRDWLTFAMVIVATIACLNYSIPMFGVRLKDVPLLKTFLAPGAVVAAIFIPPWLREGASAHAFPALAWAWCFLVFNVIVCDARDIVGDGACGTSTLPSLLGEKRTRFVLAALMVITTALALSNWPLLAALGAAMLTIIFLASRTRRSEPFYEWLVEGMMFLPALVVAIVPHF